jgi:hypothetical protein
MELYGEVVRTRLQALVATGKEIIEARRTADKVRNHKGSTYRSGLCACQIDLPLAGEHQAEYNTPCCMSVTLLPTANTS